MSLVLLWRTSSGAGTGRRRSGACVVWFHVRVCGPKGPLQRCEDQAPPLQYLRYLFRIHVHTVLKAPLGTSSGAGTEHHHSSSSIIFFQTHVAMIPNILSGFFDARQCLAMGMMYLYKSIQNEIEIGQRRRYALTRCPKPGLVPAFFVCTRRDTLYLNFRSASSFRVPQDSTVSFRRDDITKFSNGQVIKFGLCPLLCF